MSGESTSRSDKSEKNNSCQTRFEASHFTAATNIHTAICATAANFPFTKMTYQTISRFTPCFITIFYYLNSMDHLMTSTKRWTDNCMGWVPPFSQIYMGMLLYIQTMRAMEASGYLLPGSEISLLLGHFCNRFPLQNLWIPGPLVSAFKSVSCFSPSPSGDFGNVTPALPASPGWSRTRRYRIADAATTHLPNISLFISRLNSVCAAAARHNMTSELLFLSDVDGPRYMANLFSQPCDQSANEQANLTSPGACLTYPGDLRLWQDANAQLPFLGIPQSLDVNATEVDDNWTTFLRLSEDSTWFGSIADMMAKYCQFWKGSESLYDCSPSSSAAGAVRCTATSTNVFSPPQWTAQTGNHNATNLHQVGHYSMRSNLSLIFKSATSLKDIPLNHVFAAHTYNIYLSPNDDGHAALRFGDFWTIFPDAYYTNSGIQIHPGIFSSLARDYHSDSWMILETN